ncbi:MAG: fatty acyl-AMP ligase [Planctomycetes bacterium]|nr:fatty acyl-AMP ligase [Planctomycetota bacterium]
MVVQTSSGLHYTTATTLGGMLEQRAGGPQGADMRFLFVREDDVPAGMQVEGEDESLVFTFSEIYTIARRAAAHLRERGVLPGDRVLLILPTGPSFMAAFYGCQVLGAIPVPVVPPFSLARMDEHLARIARIARICEAKATVANDQLAAVLSVARKKHRDARQALSNVVLGRDLLNETSEVEMVRVEGSDPGFIQFTSGSTGDPKGVVLPHASLLANIRAIGEGAEFRETDIAVSWLPLFHDMGLIGHFLASVAWGLPLIKMPPEKFVRRPKEWLKAMSRYKGTASAAPNFAYSLCVKKVRDKDIEGVDLSSWRVAICGAEPINPTTVEAFANRFAEFGFKREAFYPVYGMAEFSLAASFPPPGRAPHYDRIDRRRFESKGIADAVESDAMESTADMLVSISVGQAMPGDHGLRIVDAKGSEVSDRREGEIEVRGASLMEGYYKAPLKTADAIRNGWLRTGDRGYFAEGELYVTGRTKEMIIKGGKNLYPQDIEAAAAKIDGVRVGCSAAFGISNAQRGTEDVVLICETRAEDDGDRSRIKAEIRTSVLRAVGATPDVIVLVSPGTVPKTSSGKIQRDLMRKRYLTGDLRPGRPSLFTLVRLKVATTVQGVRSRGLRTLLRRRDS